jgi:hypothetical protein
MIFTTKVIEIQPDGKYHCPDSTCCVSETPTNFHRLVKHCVKHSIKLSKAKVKKESTIREENRIAKRKAKKRKIIEEMDENITIERWQQNIMLNLSEADGNLKLMLMNCGVIVVREFIDSKDVDILNGCVRIAQFLSERDESEIEERIISGGTLMIDIPVNHFAKENVNFSSGANVLDLVSQMIKKMLGDEYSIVGDLSFLTTPNGVQKQFIHSDNILKNRYNGLIVLSDFATPTLFLPKQQPDVTINASPLLDLNGKIVDPNIRTKIKEKYSYMWGPVEEIESKMRPLSSKPLKRGDLVLFEADMVHRGDESMVNKTLLFFHARDSTATVQEDLQFHAGLLGSMIYGNIPGKRHDKNEYFGIIKRHDEALKDATVSLPSLLNEDVSKEYMKWLGKQPASYGI